MARSFKELQDTNTMSQELKEALKQRPPPNLPVGDIVAHRAARAAHLSSIRHLMPIPGPIPEHVHEEKVSIKATDGYTINAIIYRPVNTTSEKGNPLVVLYHEGGWMAGDATDEEFNARLLSKELGVVCINVEYRLVPENPFPIGISDCWRALQWAAENASEHGADPRRGFIVGGSSAGGHIAAVLAQYSRAERLEPPLTGQWLSVPFLIPFKHVPERFKDEFISPFVNNYDPVLSRMDPWTEFAYFQLLQADVDSPLFSPMAPAYYPPKEDNSSKAPLARAFLQVAGMDPLRDHGLVYDRILREQHGVQTKLELYPGFGHMFWTNWPEMNTSLKFSQDMVQGFSWLLK